MSLKIIFMGTPEFSVRTFHALRNAGHEIVAVVTQPDTPRNQSAVKQAAVACGVPVHQPVKVREPQFVETLRGIEADVVVVVAFGQILPKSILEMKKYGCINVHASLLPAYRGAAPIQWAIINGEAETGVTIIQMDATLDTGDILLKSWPIPLEEDETAASLHERLSKEGALLCVRALREMERGTLAPEKQGDTTTMYASMLKKETGKLDFTQEAVKLERLVRGLNPWPGAFTILPNGKTLKIWASAVVDEDAGRPGEVVEAGDELVIQTSRGRLKLTEVQLEGKKRMGAAAFLRGHPIQTGVVL